MTRWRETANHGGLSGHLRASPGGRVPGMGGRRGAVPGGAAGLAEVERVAGIVRRDIASGVTGPGEWLREQGIAMRHGCTFNTARSALAVIRREGLALRRDRNYYAITCPATLEAPSARMGERSRPCSAAPAA